MNTYLLCLRKDQSRGLQAENAIFNAACKFGLKKENCESFCNVREFFRRLSEIFDEESLIILAADTEMFADTKRMICSALFLNCMSGDVNSDDFIPEGAIILPTSDSAFSGFAIKKNSNCLILLPLDDERTQQCLGDHFFNFMSETIGETKTVSENSDNDLNFTMALISEKASDVCNVLAARKLSAALSLSNAGDRLCRVLPEMAQLSFFSSTRQRENISPKNYAAVLAREAAERSGKNIGASITNVFKTQNNGEIQFFVYIAVADINGAKVRKIYAQPDESALSLTVCALDAVLDMIKEQAMNEKTSSDGENEARTALPTPFIKNANLKKILKYTACASAAALFLCLSVGIGAIILKPESIPSSNTGTSKNESGTNDKSDFDYENFWDSLFNNDSDEESADDSPVIDEPANDDVPTGDSSGDETTAPSVTEQDTDSSQSEVTSENTPTQPSTEKPTDETNPTEPGTEDSSEPTQEPSTETPTETQPTEPTEPTVPEDSTAAAENQPAA